MRPVTALKYPSYIDREKRGFTLADEAIDVIPMPSALKHRKKRGGIVDIDMGDG